MQFVNFKNSFSMLCRLLFVGLWMISCIPANAQDKQLQKANIKALIQAFVEAQANKDEKIELQIATLPANVPEKPCEWLVSCRKHGIISGKTVFTLTTMDEKGQDYTIQVVADVKKNVPVYMLNKSVDRHYIIQEKDLDAAIKEITWPSTEHAVDLQEALGKRTTRQITSGRILTSSMLEEIPVVERGENLTMQVLEKNLFVEIPVVSQGQGYRGEIIKVRNATTDVYYLAEIIDESTVIYRSTKR
jgi:flagella basal body P-ring formation protein FlgA